MFRNRGGLPNMGTGKVPGGRGGGLSRRWFRRPFVVYYDSKLLAIEVIINVIVVIAIILMFIFGYKTGFTDPLANIKNNFIKAQYILIGISSICLVLLTIFNKSKERLIHNLKSLGLITILIIIILFGVKINIDSKYDNNKELFSQYYEMYEKDKENGIDQTINITLNGVKLTEVKQAYIETSIEAYNIFQVKTSLIIALHLCVVLVIFYVLSKISKINEKEERLEKDDNILYDEEQNIKY